MLKILHHYQEDGERQVSVSLLKFGSRRLDVVGKSVDCVSGTTLPFSSAHIFDDDSEPTTCLRLLQASPVWKRYCAYNVGYNGWSGSTRHVNDVAVRCSRRPVSYGIFCI